jgi:hypothetical protein
MQFLGQEDVGATLSAEEATEQMSEWGLSYNKPQSEAGLEWDLKGAKAKVKRDNIQARVQSGFISKSMAMAGGFAAAMTDIPTLGTMLIPGAHEIRAAMGARAAFKGIQVARGTAATLTVGGTTLKVGPKVIPKSVKVDALAGFTEGVLFDAGIEVPNWVMAQDLQEEYSIRALMLSSIASGTLTSMIQVPRGVWGVATQNARLKGEFEGLLEGIAAEPSHAKRLEMLSKVRFDFLEGEDLISSHLRKLADLELKDPDDVLSMMELRDKYSPIDAAVRSLDRMAEEDRFPGFGGMVDSEYGGATLHLFTPQVGKKPEMARVDFLHAVQRGLDHDIFFMTRELDVRMRQLLDSDAPELAARTIRQGVIASEEAQRLRVQSLQESLQKVRGDKGALRAERRATRQKRLDQAKAEKAELFRQQGRLGETDFQAEDLNVFVEGLQERGMQLGVRELDELPFTPNANANLRAKLSVEDETLVSWEDVLESSKLLDDLGVILGAPEVKTLDRSAHLLKSLELRTNIARTALGDTLNGNPVRTQHLLRQAVIMDMHERGMMTDVEYRTVLEKLVKEHREALESPSAGVYAGPEVTLLSDAEVKKGTLDPIQQTVKNVEDADDIIKRIDEAEASEGDLQFGDREYVLEQRQQYDDAASSMDALDTPKGAEAVQKLANCMAGKG